MSFPDIQTKFSIPSSEFLTYLQISSLLEQLNIFHTPIPTQIWKHLKSSNFKAKGISLIYEQLNSKSVFLKLNPLIKWEKDIGKSFTEKQWLSAIKCNHRFSRCLNYEELAVKLLAKWHFTPYIVAKFSDGNSNLCWRGCGQVGTVVHMVWVCPHLRGFWLEVFKWIAKVTGVITQPSIEKAILSINMLEYPISVRSIAMHIIFAARSLMMSKWKTNEMSSVRELITKVNIVAEYEKILAYKDGSNAKYVANWSIWNYLNHPRV